MEKELNETALCAYVKITGNGRIGLILDAYQLKKQKDHSEKSMKLTITIEKPFKRDFRHGLTQR